ncbi:hypothetical protein [Croceicoccus gelatinilyticus]|uniref:hypothetical protein n=1 Tax=Croceicoccus gelatinilyticus TaxID=2835536 RepID=UPI001BCC22D4|nr:hypothetical protein [Croceicoccus gelatinilyticus]MBS7671786.1 hypothetical protein [Croceicoccus gelatinilyticus]
MDERLIAAFKAAYEDLQAARRSGRAGEIAHAERNFYAASEAFARRLPDTPVCKQPALRKETWLAN